MSLGLPSCSPKHPPYIDERSPTHPSSQGGAADDSDSAGDGGNASPSTPGKPKPPNNVGVGVSAVLDPNEVYLWGTLSPGASYRDAIALVTAPNQYLTGFGDYADDRSARFVGNTMIYDTTFEDIVREFVPDIVSSLELKDLKYPEHPTDNDPEVATPACMGTDTGFSGIVTSPGGRMLYQCNGKDGATWYEGSEVVVTGLPFPLMALNDNNVGLLYEFSTADLSTPDVQHRVEGIVGETLAVRVHGDGFSVVMQQGTTVTLWHIAPDGSAENMGQFPDPPEGVVASQWLLFTRASALAPDDTLYQFGSRLEGNGADLILARSVGGDSTVVYDEADNPRVKSHASALMTGP